MAASACRACYTSEQVVAFINDDGEAELDDCFYPGSDDELGFEEVEVAESEDEDTKYGNKYLHFLNLPLTTMLLSDSERDGDQDDDDNPDGGVSDDVRCVHECIIYRTIGLI